MRQSLFDKLAGTVVKLQNNSIGSIFLGIMPDFTEQLFYRPLLDSYF